MRIIAAFILIFVTANQATASEVTAVELKQYCAEVDRGLVGSSFDKQLAQSCKSYIEGFFDSMIVFEGVTGEKPFCIPRALPKTQNNLILSKWIDQNKEIAATTTASVALYAAFKKAFPCN